MSFRCFNESETIHMNNTRKYIYTIYQNKSFSKAAEQLFITQPALSIAVRKEEELWGTTFFDRNSHPISLTPAGELYIRKIEELMRLEQELKHQISDLSNLGTGELQIAGTQYINSYILPPVIKAYMNRYPGINMTLHENSPKANLQSILDGKASVTFNSGAFDPQLFEQAPIFFDYVLLAVPRSFSINKRYLEYGLSHEQILHHDFSHDSHRSLPAQCFADIPMIFLSPNTYLHQCSMEICQDAGFYPNIIFMVDQSTTAFHLAKADIGAVWVSNLIVANSPDCDLVYYQVDSSKIKRTYYALTSKKRYTDKATLEFIRMCQQVL